MSNPSPSPDAGRVRFRKLRIAWSIMCGIACLLSIVLWVRSYWWNDRLECRLITPNAVQLRSFKGRVAYITSHQPAQWKFASIRIPASNQPPTTKPQTLLWTWSPTQQPGGMMLILPMWLLAAPLAALGVAPWLRWRFSLRTLLIALTLVAVILGAIVYAVK